jgi:predicted transcriptional regulator
MRIKQVTLGIKSLEQAMDEVVHVVNDAQRGRLPKKPIRGTYFVSLEAFQRVLTPKRLELLHIIREKQPGSIYELAQLARRDLKNVQDDVGLLNRLDLVSLNRKSTPRARVVPTVNYDQLHLHIPII